MQASLIDRPTSWFVGLRVVGKFDELGELVPEARRELLRRQFEIQGILNPYVLLGVSVPGEHGGGEDEVPTYIGFEVDGERQPPSGMHSIALRGGKYAAFEWQGSFLSDEFEDFYPSIFAWFKARGTAPSSTAPWIEVYGGQHDWDDKANPRNRLTVLMPLEGVPA